MAENIQWIKLKVGMFDGNSFKKIKRAKIGGVSYRDKLTAVWFELMDLAGKSNSNGFLIDNNEIPYRTFEDIAVMLDREEKEIELCMKFFISEQMIEIINDIFCLSNFMKYQNQEGLEKIREQKRIAQSKWRERKKLGLIQNVDEKTSTQTSTNNLPSQENKNKDIDIDKDIDSMLIKKIDSKNAHTHEEDVDNSIFDAFKRKFGKFYEYQKTPRYIKIADDVIFCLVELSRKEELAYKGKTYTHEEVEGIIDKLDLDFFIKIISTISLKGNIENKTYYVWGMLFNQFEGVVNG